MLSMSSRGFARSTAGGRGLSFEMLQAWCASGMRPHTMTSWYEKPLTLPQWIIFDTHEIRGIVFGCRMRPATLLICDFFGARSAHQAGMTVISFDAARLGVEPVRFLALP
jgi:hypothetical protein